MTTAVREALGRARSSAVHLEMRDIYTLDDPDFADWRAGVRFDPAERWKSWFDLVVSTVSRGVRMRRARVVSEPVSEYIKFEYDVTERHNVAAGEEVRWLPRRRAADLALRGLLADRRGDRHLQPLRWQWELGSRHGHGGAVRP